MRLNTQETFYHRADDTFSVIYLQTSFLILSPIWKRSRDKDPFFFYVLAAIV